MIIDFLIRKAPRYTYPLAHKARNYPMKRRTFVMQWLSRFADPFLASAKAPKILNIQDKKKQKRKCENKQRSKPVKHRIIYKLSNLRSAWNDIRPQLHLNSALGGPSQSYVKKHHRIVRTAHVAQDLSNERNFHDRQNIEINRYFEASEK